MNLDIFINWKCCDVKKLIRKLTLMKIKKARGEKDQDT